ncbi:bifunctional 2-polyprenyl-6-hydroxyphenol methylase/3-demethylubiquinol 3-O-methyltransferase UbiG [Paraglaciecola sp.]|uniref:class I SAM-dependent methyltransferase n=1 Tax=Paraglaciecola sp. TaxID=1920173 RepID=UPI0027401B4A|nr:class I SAM-dependent methyltransferase [Paraglaciecola sp.]MDP5029873.1 class I SAM-dependent methyltransferase [Paraglaciecola sp.]
MFDKTIDYYNQHADSFAASTALLDMSALYAEFLPLLKPKGHILDAGCGSGRDASYFKQQGFTVSAFDASQELVNIASINLQQKVELTTFQQLEAQEQYDGIWCCASLLHVAKGELPDVFARLQRAMRPSAVLYVSFKYGTAEREQGGRLFTDLNQELLNMLLATQSSLTLLKSWQTPDIRPERSQESWLNAVITKVAD